MIVRPAPDALLALLVLGSAACGIEGAGARVVAGLTTDMAVGFDIHRIDRTTKVDGVLTHAESLSYRQGDLSLPAELLIESTHDGALFELSIAAFRDGEAAPIVTRTAATRTTNGRTLLLPVSLDEVCSAAGCPAGFTCVQGACAHPFTPASALTDYDPMWIVSAKDACKTPLSADPAVVIGKGKSAFSPLDSGEVVPIEAGPQGGHHVWLALHVTGLRQMGSRLTVTGYFPDLAFELLPFRSQLTLRKAGDHCEIYGIRFQVDRGIPVETIRGQLLDIAIVLEDPNGDVATATKRVVIAP